MAQYTSPGVYVTESTFATSTVTGPTTTAAAFLGTALRGPTTPVAVESWGAYKALFGDISSAYDLGYALYHFFANGGRTAYVTRVVGAGASNAAATASTSNWSVKAANPGTWGNSLTVVVETSTITTGSTPAMTLIVKNAGTEVERWSEVSLNPDSTRFINNVVNNYSQYITTYGVTNYAGASYTVAAQTLTLTGGGDGAALTDDTNSGTQAAWASALDTYDSIQGQLLFNLVGKSNATIIVDAINYVETRGDSFLIIDPDASLGTDTIAIKQLVTNYGASSYAAVYYGMLSMSNPAAGGTASLRNTYPGGAIAGLYTRVDTERSVAKAPAGYAYELRNTFGTVSKFTESQIGDLYTAHINVVKAVPGAGVIVNGARTLKKTDLTKYVPTRRSLNFIKANVEQISQFAVFEPNGEKLWSDVSSRIANFLSSFWSNGGLRGNSASEAYFITCDSTNNTTASVEAGEVNIEVGVALQTPAEFIVINISQFVGGSQVQETL
jgi:phage tail sheath protein FI